MAGCKTIPGNWALGAALLEARSGNADGCRTLVPGEAFPNSAQSYSAHGDLTTTLDTIEPWHEAVQSHASRVEGCETTAFMPAAFNSGHANSSVGACSIPDATLDHLPINHGNFVSSLDRSYAFNPGIGLGMLEVSRGNVPPVLQSNPQPLPTVAACSSSPQDALPAPPPPPAAPNFSFESPSTNSCVPQSFASQPPMHSIAPQPLPSSIALHPSNSSASTAPTQAPTPSLSSAASRQREAELREAWTMDSVLEIYSTGTNRWNVAHVIWVAQNSVGPNVLSLQFYQEDGAKNKSLYRNDHQLAPLGTHCAGQLPAGCQVVSSQSRPGQCSYFDSVSGVKYETIEQVWKVHFERVSKNVISVQPLAKGVQQPVATSAAVGAPQTSALRPTPSFPAERPCPELAAAFTQMLPHMQAHMGSSAAQCAVKAAAMAPRDPRAGGKVALPGFAANPVGVEHQQNCDSDELLVTNGLSLAAQLMGKQGAACGMAPGVNSGTVRRFEMVK